MNKPQSLASLKERAKLPLTQAGKATVAKFFEANKAAVAAVLPKHLTPEYMLKVALQAIRTTPALGECTSESLFGACIQCASLGLVPNSVMGHAYLVPFNKKTGNAWQKDVQVIIGYRGLIDLARRSGQIVSIAAHVVHEEDHFEYQYGLHEMLEHRPAGGERGPIKYFYAVAHLKDGGHAFEVMTRAEVDGIRDNAQGYKQALMYAKKDKDGTIVHMNSPWFTHYDQMGRKTAIRRLSKFLPLSVEFNTAANLDTQAEMGAEQDMAAVLRGEFSPIDQEALPYVEAAEEAGEQWPQEVTDPETGDKNWFDANGEAFDKSRHGWSRANGKPSVTPEGVFRVKRGAGRQDGDQEENTDSEVDESPQSKDPETGTDQA